MPSRHNQFVHEENIRRFEAKLRAETDPEKRTQLEKLLADELALRLPLPQGDGQGYEGSVGGRPRVPQKPI